MDSLPSKYPEFLKLEFAPLDALAENQQMVVATLAFSKMALSAEEVATILSLDVSLVHHTVALCPFLKHQLHHRLCRVHFGEPPKTSREAA